MALYALGDLHLSFQTDKSMDVFGGVWRHHEKKIEKQVNRLVKPEDTLVLTGDHSWGRKLEECREDLDFIENLPGRKILLRGNHDMFWDAKRQSGSTKNFRADCFFLQNNFAVYRDYALVGTKGYTFEGPFYLNRRGQILGWDEKKEQQARKLVSREMTRLREAFRQAWEAGYRKFILFLHYPSYQYSGENLPFYGDRGTVPGGGGGILHCHARAVSETVSGGSITG